MPEGDRKDWEIFLNKIQRMLIIKEKTDKPNSIKTKNLC